MKAILHLTQPGTEDTLNLQKKHCTSTEALGSFVYYEYFGEN